jgi:hypothetical protein
MQHFLGSLYGWIWNHAEYNGASRVLFGGGAKQAGLYCFILMLILGVLVAYYFYQVYIETDSAKRATLSQWLRIGLIGMLICFIATEAIIALQEDNNIYFNTTYIGNPGMCWLKFSLLNSVVYYSIVYLISSKIISKLPPALAPKLPF